MLIRLAWRNIFRNKRRTFIAGIAIGIGLASLIFTDALIIGMEKNMINSATSSFLGEAQIHNSSFLTSQEVESVVNNLAKVTAELDKDEIVRHYTLRTISYGMITSPANVQSIDFVGINPQTEKNISKIVEAVTQGSFFNDDNPRDLLIGSKLADILEVGLGDRIVITVAQAYTGDLSQEMFYVSGIFHFDIDEMDKGMAFSRLEKAQEMLGIGKQVHEIAIQFTDSRMARNKNLPFWQKFSRFGNEAVSWTQLLPQLEAALKLTDFSTYITALLLFGVVALGIVNTLFMSIHERMFEFGVLRAVGTRPFDVARLMVFEAGSLAIVSILLGNILGFGVTYATSLIGIDYKGIEFAGVTFRELLYPVLKPMQFIKYPFWVFFSTILVSFYPAIYAAKMSPSKALRKSM